MNGSTGSLLGAPRGRPAAPLAVVIDLDRLASAAVNLGWRVPLAVAIGGAVGAGLRWATGRLLEVEPGPLPVATLVVNVTGCLLIGVAAGRLHRDSLAWAFTVTGVLGGFTTMSAFAQELNDLADADRYGVVALYVGLTFAGGMLALLAAERVSEAWPP